MDSIRIMPKCALCDKQAWRWVVADVNRTWREERVCEIALCSEHAEDRMSIEAVRKLIDEQGLPS